jgi:hypothetical protein
MSANAFRWPELRARISIMDRGLACALFAALFAVACSADEPSGTKAQPQTVCDYGTKYPNANVIDPDSPVYEDASWTQQEVVDNFVEAKSLGLPAYPAYRAAREHSQYLECAYCKCGCGGPTLAHQSAIDCFKDMHGFA